MTIQTAAADQAVFIDRKKPLWLFSLVWLSLPAVGSFVAVATNSEFALWIVPIAWFGFIPILDRLCARDQSCPRAVQIGHLDKQLYYSLVVGLAVPIVYATLFYCASVVARLNFSVLGFVGTGLSLGIVFGTLLTVSRASGRCQTPTEKMLGFFATSIVGFGHFRLAHTVAHQQNCATPGDPSSARMGESLYKFFLRSLHGSTRQAWVLEKRRLAHLSHIRSLFTNEITQCVVFAIVLHGAIVLVFGLRVLPVLLMAISSAWFFQTAIVYIQRYGLLREKRADGAYVRCSSRHAWNSTHAASALLLFNATRHADAHVHPARRFQSLGVDNAAAQLPFGFAAAIIIAFLPPYWFRTMDPAVADWAGGDLLKVNIDGEAYMSLMAQFHRPRG